MSTSDLTPDQYQSQLEKGLGRAVLYLQSHDSKPYRDVILHACMHDLRFERSCDSGRDQYLADILKATGEPEYYVERVVRSGRTCLNDSDALQMVAMIEVLRDAGTIERETEIRCPLILQHMREGTDLHHVETECEIARHLAGMGDDEARVVLYDLFDRSVAAGREDGASQMLTMDGVAGFLHVARRVAGLPNTPEDRWCQSLWLDELEERDGKEGTLDRLRDALRAEPELLLWLDAVCVERNRERPRPPSGRPLEQWSYEQARAFVDRLLAADRFHWGGILRCGRFASDGALAQLAGDLVAETDARRLAALLGLFRRRQFPLHHNHLVRLASHPDDSVRWRAAGALALLRHDDVRACALELVACPGYAWDSIEVLSANACEGDHRLVDEVLRRDLDPDTMHRAGQDARTFFEKNPDQPCSDGLALVYERGRCSSCRTRVVEMLIKRGLLPDWMREECRYDCEPDTRKAVQ